MTFVGKARHGAAAAEDFVIRMCRPNQGQSQAFYLRVEPAGRHVGRIEPERELMQCLQIVQLRIGRGEREPEPVLKQR